MEGISPTSSNTWTAKEIATNSIGPASLLTAALTIASPGIGTTVNYSYRIPGKNEYTQQIGNTGDASKGFSKELIMSGMSKDEIEARLARNKAEVESIAHGMKAEISDFKRVYTENFAEISKTLNRMESKADATEKRLTQAQWIISAVIALSALTISISFNIASKSHASPSQQQPITINTAPTASNHELHK